MNRTRKGMGLLLGLVLGVEVAAGPGACGGMRGREDVKRAPTEERK